MLLVFRTIKKRKKKKEKRRGSHECNLISLCTLFLFKRIFQAVQKKKKEGGGGGGIRDCIEESK